MVARGGKRAGAGRPAGVPNKITADIKALAQVHAATAITQLATILTTSENDQARIAAAKELLDRGYGKSTQHAEITGKDDGPVEMKTTIVNAHDVKAIVDRLEDEY